MTKYVRGNQRVKGNSIVEGFSINENSGNGTAGSGVTAVHYGDGKNIISVLTLSGITLSPTGAAALGLGALIFTFPAGTHVHEVTNMNVTLQGGGTVDADTPDVGIGSVVASGVVSVLSGTATFEDYITGQTATDCNGTAIPAFTAATAGALTGISLNAAGDSKAVYLNIADTWAGADTITLAGTVVIKWAKM